MLFIEQKSIASVLLIFAIALIFSSTAFAAENKTNTTTTTKTTTNLAAGSPAAGSTISFTSTQINNAAASVNSYINKYKKLPSYVPMSNTRVTMPQFLSLMAQNTININSKTPKTITLTTVNTPTTATETVKTGTITKTEYINIAKTIKYVCTYKTAPSYINTTKGRINFQNMIYTFSKILSFQKTYNRLPNYVTTSPWKGTTTTSSTTTTTSVSTQSFTSAQINAAAISVNAYIVKYKLLPSYVPMGSVRVSMAQFLSLMAQNVINIYSGTPKSLTLTTVNTPATATETVKTGNISKTEYINIAKTIKYVCTYKTAPSYINTTKGRINFQTMVYTFSKILSFQKTYNRLPNYVTVIPWTNVTSSEGSSSTSSSSSSTSSALAKYLVATTNAQSTNSTIIKLANSITSGLTSTYAKATAIFNWVRNNLSYSYYYNSKKGALGALSSRSANCCDTAHLVVALARAAGIPARYQHGYCHFSDGWFGHVWAQLYVNGKWYYADAISDYNTFGSINNWNLSTVTIYGTYAALPF